MMTLTEQLLTLADTFCGLTGKGRGTVSAIILKKGSRLDEIALGADLTTKQFERARQWFSDHWPEDRSADWPDGIYRPAPLIAEAQP